MSNAPLFPTIPLTIVVIDNLHLFVQVSDVLLDLLITELKRQDSIEKVKRFSSFDITKYKHMQGFEQFIKGLGIPSFEFYVGWTSKVVREWGRDFLCVYQSKEVTPYVHPLRNHVGQFMQIHGIILPFTQQGLEKLNDVTKNFFRLSCHRDEALKQLIEKQNWIEHLNDAGKKRAKLFEVECSNCSKHGHNRLTCSEPCKHCGHCYC